MDNLCIILEIRRFWLESLYQTLILYYVHVSYLSTNYLQKNNLTEYFLAFVREEYYELSIYIL